MTIKEPEWLDMNDLKRIGSAIGTISLVLLATLAFVLFVILIIDTIGASWTGDMLPATILDKIYEPPRTETRMESYTDYDGDIQWRTVTDRIPEKHWFVIEIEDWDIRTDRVARGTYYKYDIGDQLIAERYIGWLGITKTWRIKFP